VRISSKHHVALNHSFFVAQPYHLCGGRVELEGWSARDISPNPLTSSCCIILSVCSGTVVNIVMTEFAKLWSHYDTSRDSPDANYLETLTSGNVIDLYQTPVVDWTAI